ncbi:hypothetical protein [Mobilicoccus pelagius]|uniref:N-acetyltransferase domain-containing protein n=1 Tax=Mobilicoccus pelagius NBRC 104925 TaxID=1089455 RepID=H5UN32_9MICO|nr:hypothetical protein [Mobilicoccus pelagius]GAB47140.1 hypothetical protein MOPEL_005_00010 [Mobilicoccus pelagius NBRC 104925]
MVTPSYRIETLTVRDRRQLRDLVERGSSTGQCRELAAAVGEAPDAAVAWRQRTADLCGDGRYALLARDADGVPVAFVAAYVDGEGADRYVVVRHVLVLPTPAEDTATTDRLLGCVEEWAATQYGAAVLLEVDDRAGLEDVLRARGYDPTGARRSSFESLVDDALPTSQVSVWHRLLRNPHSHTATAIFAVAS